MDENTPWVAHEQRFCLHDGPGIRTTVFFKGCSLRCAWCHNPEMQAFDPEMMVFRERCLGCGRCSEVCPAAPGACVACGRCAEVCPVQARERVGRQIPVEKLVASLLRDRSFFDSSGGGVTLSGGEVMAQEEGYVRSLLLLLKRQGVHTAVDTCGHAPWQRFERILPDVQVFLYDLKALDPKIHRRYTGVDNALILDNLRHLSDAGARIHLRVPVIPEVNLGEMDAMMDFVRREVRAERIHLLAYHRLGSDKRDRLGAKEAEVFTEPDAETMGALAKRWQAAGLDDIRIGG